MSLEDVLYYRLINQRLAQTTCRQPEELVSWFCGMQAQDYGSSKWAIGARMPHVVDEDVERAISEGRIVRSWLMRGTLHLTTPDDIYWLLDLLAPRIKTAQAFRHRQLELDEPTFHTCFDILARALEGHKQLTRHELAALFQLAGVDTSGQRLIHILQKAALEQIICFGARRHKEFTFTLLQEHVPVAKRLDKETALAEIARKYFSSHGPATLPDFVWWSGLTVAEARKGIDLASAFLTREEMDGQSWYFDSLMPFDKREIPGFYLLPAFDEYVLGYKDRRLFLDPARTERVVSKNGIFYPVMLANGKVAGIWKRTAKGKKIMVEPDLFFPLDGAFRPGLEQAVQRFGLFSGGEACLI